MGLRGLFEGWHIVILVVVVVLVFGWKRLPDAARSLGRSMRIFKAEVGEMKNDAKPHQPSAASSDTVRGETVAAPAGRCAPPTPPAARRRRPRRSATPPARPPPRTRPRPARSPAPRPEDGPPHLETPSMAILRRRRNPEGRMSLGDHLRELRNRLIVALDRRRRGRRSVGWLALRPAAHDRSPSPCGRSAAQRGGDLVQLNFAGVTTSFSLKLKVSLFVGVDPGQPGLALPGLGVHRPGPDPAGEALRDRLRRRRGAAVPRRVLPGLTWSLPKAVRRPPRVHPRGRHQPASTPSDYLDLRHPVHPRLRPRLPAAGVPGRAQHGRPSLPARVMLKGWRVAVFLIFVFAAMMTADPGRVDDARAGLPDGRAVLRRGRRRRRWSTGGGPAWRAATGRAVRRRGQPARSGCARSTVAGCRADSLGQPRPRAGAAARPSAGRGRRRSLRAAGPRAGRRAPARRRRRRRRPGPRPRSTGGVDALVVVGGDGMVHLGVNAVRRHRRPAGHRRRPGPATTSPAALGLPVATTPAAAAPRLIDGAAARAAIDAGRCAGRRTGRAAGSPACSAPASTPWSTSGPTAGAGRAGRCATTSRSPASCRCSGRIPYVARPRRRALRDRGRCSSRSPTGRRTAGACGSARTPSLDDGLLDVLVARADLDPAQFLRVFPRVFSGTHVRAPARCEVRAGAPGPAARRTASSRTPTASGSAPLPLTCEVVPGRAARPASAA